MTDSSLIGIFDSGIGGFSVLKEVRKVTTSDIIYFGDCGRAPYGNRDGSEIVIFIKEILLNLKSRGATHFVSACNSMSVLTTDVLLEECNIPKENYIDMSRSVEYFIKLPSSSNVLVIGTQATIASGVYRNVLESRSHRVIDYPLTSLASLIESNASIDELISVIKGVVSYAKEIEATHILYACTHYPLIHNMFENVRNELKWFGIFIDPSIYVSEAVNKWNLTGEHKINFETSLTTVAFEREKSKYK